MDVEKAISLENLNRYKNNTNEKIKSYVDTKTSVIQDGTKAVGGVSAEDYNNFNSAYEDKHTHSNKSVLDEISEKTLNGGEELSGSTGYTVTDSVEYPIVGMKVYGKSKQKQYSGKNLYQGTKSSIKSSNGWYCIYGGVDEITLAVEDYKLPYGEQLTLSLVYEDSLYTTIKYKKNGEFTTIVNEIQLKTITFTIPVDYDELFIYSRNGKNNSFNINNIQIELGSTATAYEPYVGGIPSPNPDYPQEITSVVEPTVTVCGKNLLSRPTVRKYNQDGITVETLEDGTYHVYGSTTTDKSVSVAVPLQNSVLLPSQIVYLSINNSAILGGSVNFVDENNKQIEYWSFSKINRQAAANQLLGKTISKISVYIANNTVCDFTFKLQIELNDYSDYEPYTSHTLTLSDTLNAIPVSSGGNVTIDGQRYIADYVDFEEGKYHRLVDPDKLDPTVSIVDNLDLLLETEEITDIPEAEMQAYRQLQTYNGTTNISNDKGAGLSVEYCTSKMLAEYALPLIKDLEAENAKKDEEISALKTDILTSEKIHNRIYEGINLAEKFASEINSEYNGDTWSWINDRIDAQYYTGMRVGDYIPYTAKNGFSTNARIMGIDTYKGYGDTPVGSHIDFISDDLWTTLRPINKVNYNNGTESQPYPWLASGLYLYLNSLSGTVPNSTTVNPETIEVDYTADGVYYYLPDELKAVIKEKRFLLPKRYSASGLLADDNQWGWANIGKLWLPDECEVYGAPIWGGKGFSAGGSGLQYPLFAGNMNRLKFRNGGRYYWWLLSPYSGDSSGWCGVHYSGDCNLYYASDGYIAAPVCFRV